MRIWTAGIACTLAVSLTWTAAPQAGPETVIPLACSKGPSGQHYDTAVTAPKSVTEGSTFTVRVDGSDSGKISHMGLNYIHDMAVEMLIPSDTTYVEGSARVIPDTGSANVRPGARVTRQGRVITLLLPAHVQDGSSYAPPSFEYQLRVSAAAGANVVQKFSQYRVTANAFLIGDVLTTCDPTPKPYSVATTLIAAAAPPPAP